MNLDPNDIVRQALDNLTAQNGLLAAQAEIAALKERVAESRRRVEAEGHRMRAILADLEDVETNAVTKAVIREAIERWDAATRGDA